MRTKYSSINILYSLIGQFVAFFVSFLARIIFVRYLSDLYLGVNSLYSSILTILSLAELGFGTAIIFSLYKPIYENNEIEISKFINLFRRIYYIVAGAVLVSGIVTLPLLKYIIKDDDVLSIGLNKLIIYFLLFLVNAVISYFMSYKRSIIMADQKKYINTIVKYSFFLLTNITQIILLVLTRNFVLFLITQIVFTFIENLVVTKIVNKKYPYILLYKNEKLDDISKRIVYKNAFAMLSHRLGGVTINFATSIMITAFLGLSITGKYSNYLFIIVAINSIVSQIFDSFTASVGNLFASGNIEQTKKVYFVLLFINHWIAIYTTISIYVLVNPFIEVWLGIEYVFAPEFVIILSLGFYINITRKASLLFRDSLGLFWYDRKKPIFEAIIGISVALLLAKPLGIYGILLGFIIGTLSTANWIEPLILFKHGFMMKVVEYYKKIIPYFITGILGIISVLFIKELFVFENVWIEIIFLFAISFFLPNILFILIFLRSEELKYLVAIVKKILNKIIERRG